MAGQQRVDNRRARIARVARALESAGVEFTPRELSDNTATAALAARVLECRTAQIAKTIVFCAAAENRVVVAVLCGDDRVDVNMLARLAGMPLKKADAAQVKAQCGFEIGGVAPLGYPQPLPVFLERRLQRFHCIWAAAGSAYAVVGMTPAALQQASGASFADFAAD